MTDASAADVAIGRVGRSAVILTVAVGVGQLFGIGRELFIAGEVGITAGLDALLVALVVPTMLSGVLMSGTSAALVPAYASVESEAGPREARQFVAAIMTWTVVVAVVAACIVVAAGRAVIELTGPGLSPEARAAAQSFLTILAPIIVISPLAGLVAALCQVGGRFVPISISSIAGPVVAFIVTVVWFSSLNLDAMAIGTVSGALATLAVLLGGAFRAGLLSAPTLRARGSYTRPFIRHVSPLWASSMTLQVNLLVDRAIASILAVGAVSALRYGEGIVRIPLTSIGPAWGLVLYPSLVRAAHTGSTSSLGEAAVASFRYVLAIFVPLSVACIALAPLIVDVAYLRGAFSVEDAAATAPIAAALAPMIALTMVEPILIGAHNSRRRGTLLLAAGLITAAVHTILDVGLGLTLGVIGVALSTSITMAVVLGFLAIRLAAAEPSFDLRAVTRCAVLALAASVVVALPIGLWAWWVYRPGPFLVNLALLAGLTVLGFVAYLFVTSRIGLREPGIVMHTLRLRLPSPFGVAA